MQTSKLQPKNRQNRACRIELADLGKNFFCDKIHMIRTSEASSGRGSAPPPVFLGRCPEQFLTLDYNLYYFFLYMGNHAGGRMDFTRGKSKPISASLILQALSCRFFGCNLLVFVFVAFRICLCFVWFKTPHGIFSNRVGRVFGSAKRAGFWSYNPSGKSPQALYK